MADEDLLLKLGNAIQDRRRAAGFSQEAFAHVLGMHRTQLGHIEQGRKDCRLSTLVRIADGLDVPLTELLQSLSPDPS